MLQRITVQILNEDESMPQSYRVDTGHEKTARDLRDAVVAAISAAMDSGHCSGWHQAGAIAIREGDLKLLDELQQENRRLRAELASYKAHPRTLNPSGPRPRIPIVRG
jgi:hypothetical protein